MHCAHAGDPSHECCGAHEVADAGVTTASEMLRPGQRALYLERRMVMTKDPVCGMDVDAKPGATQATHQGKIYYFCGDGCKKTFERDPGRYAKA